MNIGKKFEQALKDSVPDYVLVHRLPDPAQSFGQSSNVRFSRPNPFDFLMWDSMRHVLYAIEAKTVNGKSISFERSKDDHGVIHAHQIAGLLDWAKYDGIVSGFIIEFRKIETTIFLPIDSFVALSGSLNKKSFNYNDVVQAGLQFFIIPQSKKRTKYTYDLEELFSNFTEEKETNNEKSD